METKNLKAIMTLLFVGVLMGALDLAIIGPALPAMQAEFGLDNRQLSWLFNIYVLAQLIGTPLLAKMSDRFGRRDIYIACVFAFAVGSVTLVVSSGFGMLLVGRAIQGIGASGIFPVAAAVIGDTFPEEKRGSALGLIGAVFGLAFLIGPVLGGILLQYSWHWLFVINVPIALALMIGGWRLLPSTGAPQTLPFDWAGSLLLTILLLGFALGVTNFDATDPASGLRSQNVWPYLLAGIVALPLFWMRERRAPDPVIRPAFFESRQMKLILAIAAGVGTIESALVFFPALAVAALGVTESAAAWLMLPAVFIMMIMSPVVGRLVDRTGAAPLIRASLVMLCAGLLVLGFAPMNYATFIGGGLITGMGIAALLGAPLRYILLKEASADDRASAQGLLNVFLSIGQLAGAAIVGSVAASTGGGQAGYQDSFVVLGVLTAVLAIVSLWLVGGVVRQTAAEAGRSGA